MDGKLQIGCHKFSLEYWLDNYKRIGENEDYSEKEIEIYGKLIEICKEIDK